jgi:shikimate dehydrogenase
MKKLGLIGFPLAHSFSKSYFENKFEKEKIKDFSYENFEIDNINKLPVLLKENKQIVGLNVTIPYKEQVLKYVDWKDDIVEQIGAANTLKIINGKIKAYNTDVYGFEKSFKKKWQNHHKKALILGTGGASKSVAFVLRSMKIPYLFVSRNPISSNQISYKDINKEVMKEYQIIINTTPLGTYPKVETSPDIPYNLVKKCHYFYDLVYNPAVTSFLKKASMHGATTSNGLSMLKLQAEKAWEIWTDKN